MLIRAKSTGNIYQSKPKDKNMLKKTKRIGKFFPASSSLASLVLLLLAVTLFGLLTEIAKGAAVNYSNDTTVTITSDGINFTILANSTADSVVVNATSVTAAISGSTSTFTLTSASRDLTVSSTATKTLSCEAGGLSKVVITGSGATTITPTSAACAITPGAPVTLTGGGVNPLPPGPTSTAPSTTTLNASDLQARINALTELIKSLQAKIISSGGTPPSTAKDLSKDSIPPSGSFKKPLFRGTQNPDVSSLQTFLAKLGPDIYPDGIVSGYFGRLTENAVKRLQVKYGIAQEGDPGFGRVGPKTRTLINSMLSLPN